MPPRILTFLILRAPSSQPRRPPPNSLSAGLGNRVQPTIPREVAGMIYTRRILSGRSHLTNKRTLNIVRQTPVLYPSVNHPLARVAGPLRARQGLLEPRGVALLQQPVTASQPSGVKVSSSRTPSMVHFAIPRQALRRQRHHSGRGRTLWMELSVSNLRLPPKVGIGSAPSHRVAQIHGG